MTEKTVETKDHKAASVLPARTPREAIELDRAAHPIIAVAAHLPSDIDEPFKVAEPLKLTDEQKKVAAEKADLIKQIGVILGKYNGNESEVPPNSEYWQLVAKVRALN